MPRKAPCSRCGKQLLLGPGSLPKPVCRPCRAELNPPRHPARLVCPTCGSSFESWQVRATYCSRRCKDMSGPSKSRAALRRGAGAVDPGFTTMDIADRDCWRCGICQDPIDPEARHPHPGSLSLDHIVPLSLGGDHTSENVQVAHFRCNLVKGARHPGDAISA